MTVTGLPRGRHPSTSTRLWTLLLAVGEGHSCRAGSLRRTISLRAGSARWDPSRSPSSAAPSIDRCEHGTMLGGPLWRGHGAARADAYRPLAEEKRGLRSRRQPLNIQRAEGTHVRTDLHSGSVRTTGTDRAGTCAPAHQIRCPTTVSIRPPEGAPYGMSPGRQTLKRVWRRMILSSWVTTYDAPRTRPVATITASGNVSRDDARRAPAASATSRSTGSTR